MRQINILRFPTLKYEAKEAINTLCANLSFLGGDIKKIMITSCHPQEGKSSVSMWLTRNMAELGMRVLLVDADIRASLLQGRYGIQIGDPENGEYKGLTRYLAGSCTLDEIVASTNIRDMYMILSGKNVTNSLPLLNSSRLEQLMERLEKEFDLIIVDAPPVGTIIDAAKIARCCDGTLFVVKSGDVTKKELLSAMQQMERAGSPIFGTVLNGYDEHKYGGGYYHKGYYSYYGKDEKKESKKDSKKKSSKFWV